MNRTYAIGGGLAGLLLALATHPAAAQSAGPADTLTFFGFRAGARVAELAARLDSIDGTRLRCDHAKADSHDCHQRPSEHWCRAGSRRRRLPCAR